MDKPVYFSKTEYREYKANGLSSILLLNLVDRELSYQTYVGKKKMPAIQGTESVELGNHVYTFDKNVPGRVIRNCRTDFQPVLLPEEESQYEVDFSYGIKLSDEDMMELLPYCNALDFEPYRNREMSMDDEGYIGYRDEASMSFCGVTDSYIPVIKLPMEYYYDEEHIWPSEKLYRYLVHRYFENNKKVVGHGPCYGGESLFI